MLKHTSETIWFSIDEPLRGKDGAYFDGCFVVRNRKVVWANTEPLSKLIVGKMKMKALKELTKLNGFTITHRCDFDYIRRTNKIIKKEGQ